MAPTPSRIVRLYGRPTTAPAAPLLSPTTCVWSVGRMSTDRLSARSKLSTIHNADLERQTERRWGDEDYDFYAPEEVARRNALYEAFARRVAALQSTDAGLGGRADADEYIESDELPVVDEIVVSSIDAVKNKPALPKLRVPEAAFSVSGTPSETQPTRQYAINSKTRVAEALETEPKTFHESREKSVADTLEVLVAPKPGQPIPSPSMSETQRQELEMVKEYLSKVAADFEWASTASQGLRPTSEDGVIGLSAYIIAFGFENAVKDICGVLSLESPFASKPVALDDDDEPQHDRFSRKVEKGVLRTPPRRFDGLPDAVLNRSREALIEELQRMKAESAAPQVPAA